MGETHFHKFDTVTVNNDWIPSGLKGKRARIAGFQINGGVTFARLDWCRADALTNQVGNLFPLDELKLIRK